MALVLTSAVRTGPPGCGHYNVTLTAEPGQPNQRIVTFPMESREVVNGAITQEELATFVKLAVRYYVEMRGQGFGFLLGKRILVDAPEVGP